MAAKAKQETLAAAPEAESVPASPAFELGRLRKDCLALFGVTASAFDGAAYGLTGTFTVEEMRDRINKWQNTRAVPAAKKEDY